MDDGIYDGRGVKQVIQFVESEKAGAGKMRFLAENAMEFDGMPDGLVNLQAELAAAEDQRGFFFGALRGGVEGDRLFGHLRSVLQKIHGFDQFVAAEDVLAAKAVRVRTLLDGIAFEAGGDDSTARVEAALMNFRSGAGGEPGIDLAELHVGFG